MKTMGPNLSLANFVIDELARVGVREVIVCAGARNSPLVLDLDGATEIHTRHFFEERSAAFFAVGRMLESGRPVAVVTTSGTAAAELLPAMIEAHYQGLPLIAVTADRPRRYRGTGAPQAIEQVGIFGHFASETIDLEVGEAFGLGRWEARSPAHVNVCFDEPLVDGAPEKRAVPLGEKPTSGRWTTDPYGVVNAFLTKCRSPLVILGSLPSEARESVRHFLLNLKAPIYAEALSGLREDSQLRSLLLCAGERALSPESVRGAFDGVLRIGGVPTLRLWRDLDSSLEDLPLLSISEVPMSGSPRSQLVHVPLADFFSECGTIQAEHSGPSSRVEAFLKRDQERSRALELLLEAEPASEPGMVRRFSRLVPDSARLFLGNSLPIREWDLAAQRAPRGHVVGASRGANGIDGQVSAFLGFASEKSKNWALIGDLTALYDLSGPWAIRQRPGLKAVIAVINNSGGRIFDRLFPHPSFENAHSLRFKDWALLWGLDYVLWSEVPGTWTEPAGASVVELAPDPLATTRFWREYDRLMGSS